MVDTNWTDPNHPEFRKRYREWERRENRRTLWCLVLVWTAAILALGAFAVFGEERLEPGELVYQGAFAVPQWKPGVRWGYGLAGLGYDPASGNLIGTSHGTPGRGVTGHLVAALEIPEARRTDPQTPPDLRLKLLDRAKQVSPWRDVVAPLRPRLRELALDKWGGLVVLEGRIRWSWWAFYAVQPLGRIDHPTFGASSFDGQEVRGLWKAGPYGEPVYHQKRTSRYLAVIPREWADQHVAGRRLAAGKGDGAGSAGVSHGPAIVALDHRLGASDTAELEAQSLVHFGKDRAIEGWSACDKWTGLAWTRRAVIVCGRRGTAAADCYGSPGECGAGCGTSKGNHCEPYWAELLFFDPQELARSAAGEITPEEVRPYARRQLSEFWPVCHRQTGGMAWDPAGGRLYLVQDNGEQPLIHVWALPGETATPEPPEPPEPVEPPPGPEKRFQVFIRIEGIEWEYAGRSLLEALARAQVALEDAYAEEARK